MAQSTSFHQELIERGVLIVDDSELQRDFAAQVLRELGLSRVEQAEDGTAALAVLASMAPPAVMLVDLEMPRMDGIELIHQIARQNLELALVIVSSRERMLIKSVGDMISKLGIPLLAALTKPLKKEELLGALLKYVSGIGEHTLRAPRDARFNKQNLMAALAAGEIRAFMQPQISLSNGKICSVEALARWLKADGSLVEPARFIEAFEFHGLMQELTLTILDQVLDAMQHWQQTGRNLAVAVNLAPSSLDDMQLADNIIARVKKSGIAPEKIVFEITESSMSQDVALFMGSLLKLRLSGFELSIDDYGTGFSTLEQLARLPFSELKIDRSFVSNADRDPRLETILESAINMSRGLDLRSVAEGIETRNEWNLLARLGCSTGQGYFIARPTPIEQLLSSIDAAQKRLAYLQTNRSVQ